MSANPEQPDELAKKQNAKDLFAEKQYNDALKEYTELIEQHPNMPLYYANRAACYMMLSKYSAAMEDAKKCIELDANLFKAYGRLIRSAIILGDIVQAKTTLSMLEEFDPENKTIPSVKKDIEYVSKFLKEAEVAYAAKDYRKV